jgi:hypothetical protein
MSVTPWSEGIFYLPTELVQYGVDVWEATALQPNVGNNPSDIPTSYWTIFSQGGSNVVSLVSAGLGIAVTGGGTTNPVVAANLEAGTGVTIVAGVAPQSLLISSAADGVQTVTAAVGCTVGGTATNPTVGTNLVAGGGISLLAGVGTTLGISNSGILSVDTGGAGITASTVSGAVTLNNTGVTSVIGGSNISVSAATGAVTISATGGFTPTTEVLLAQQLLAPGASGTFPVPTGGEGLYVLMGCSVPASTGQSRQGQFSVWCYVNSAQRVQMGGSGLSDLGGVGGADIMLVIPVDGTATFFYQNNGGQSLVNYSIVAFKMSGAITGAF